MVVSVLCMLFLYELVKSMNTIWIVSLWVWLHDQKNINLTILVQLIVGRPCMFPYNDNVAFA